MKLTKLSLDTNVFVFGLRKIDSFAGTILQNLWQFDVKISVQVERELQKNLNAEEFRAFYALVEMMPSFCVEYQPPTEELFLFYRQYGLKTGDAKIAAFCEQEAIEFFVSENRHFLHEFSQRTFTILDSQTFCRKFSLS